MMSNDLPQCIHCGRFHRLNASDIALHCRAVKTVTYHSDIHAEHGCATVEYAGIRSIEYVSLEEQERLVALAKADEQP